MSLADRTGLIGKSANWLRTSPRRCGFALVAVALATLAHYLLGVLTGFRGPFLLFFPTIMLVALLAGFQAGFVATLVAAVAGRFFFIEPFHTFAIRSGEDWVDPLLFTIIGIAISSLADRFRRRTSRLQEFERVVEGLEEMIVVVDRDYRYLIANRAFLNYRGMKPEDVIGRRVGEVLNPGVFETTVKTKLDECFSGKTVRYEMRYIYPTKGERELVITYFPILGPHGVDRVASVFQDVTDLKQANQSLVLFRTLIDQCNDAVSVVDPDTLRFLDVNERSCTGLGFTRDEMLSMSVYDIASNAGGLLQDGLSNRLVESGSAVFETVHRRKGGSTFPVEVSLRRVQSDRLYTVAIWRDITDRKKAEQALRESEDRYRDLVEHSSDLVCIHDLDGKLVSVNPAPARLLGYEVNELLKIPMRDLLAPEFHDQFDAYLKRISTNGADQGLLCVLTRGGERRIWEYNNTLRTEGVREPIVRGMAHDITDCKLAEEEMRRSEERFRVALKHSPITVFNQDRDLRYTWIYNPQLYWQKEVLGKTDEEIIGPKKAARLSELKKRVLTTGTALREEVAIHQNGVSCAFDMTIEPLFDGDKNVVGITGACMDIARLRQLADSLQDARDRLAQEKLYLERQIAQELGFEEIIGQSSALREVLKKAKIVAPTDSTVLLLGETGTGKELVARAVHSLSSRCDKTFVKLNCAAVPSGLLESELFGHEKGAFTGAVSQKIGRIELADKGTLFLDEIGELPPELQPKLLRVLQDREFERLGGVETLRVDVRIVSATNRDLRQEVADKKYREDLFYRLNVFPIELPPLRERRDDIPILIRHFVQKHAAKMGKHVDTIPDESMQILQEWSWPGNVRELENMIERLVILSKGPVLAGPPVELHDLEYVAEDNLIQIERDHIIRVLRETNGVLSGDDGAAIRLGMKRTTLQSMMKRLGIEPAEFRRGTGTYAE